MRKLILVCLAFVLIGCQTLKPQAEQAADIIVKAGYVDEVVKSGAVVEALYNSNLSKEDTKAIEATLKAYNDFTGKWGTIISTNPLEAVTKTSQIITEYNVLRIRYLEIERIVVANWDSYPVEQQFVLKEYRDHARALDNLVMTLLASGKASTAFIAIQKIAVVAGQIALKLL